MNPVLVVIVLSAVGVIGDYCIKTAGHTKAVHVPWFIAGLVIYALTAFGWLFAMRHMKLSSLGVIYSLATLLFLVVVGVVLFHERLHASELIGIVFAIIAIILLGRFA